MVIFVMGGNLWRLISRDCERVGGSRFREGEAGEGGLKVRGGARVERGVVEVVVSNFSLP